MHSIRISVVVEVRRAPPAGIPIHIVVIVTVVDVTVRVHKTRISTSANVRRAPPVGIRDIPTVDVDITIRVYTTRTVVIVEVGVAGVRRVESTPQESKSL